MTKSHKINCNFPILLRPYRSSMHSSYSLDLTCDNKFWLKSKVFVVLLHEGPRDGFLLVIWLNLTRLITYGPLIICMGYLIYEFKFNWYWYELHSPITIRLHVIKERKRKKKTYLYSLTNFNSAYNLYFDPKSYKWRRAVVDIQ